MITKQCLMCGSTFQTSNPKRLTCRPTCAARHEALMRGDVGSCPICGKEFIQIKIRNEKQKTCSMSCGAKLRALTETSAEKQRRGPHKPPILMNCILCGKEFINYSRQKSRKYCSRVCTSRAGGLMNKGWVPDLEWRKKASERMKSSNPMENPDIIEKAAAKKRGRSFAGDRGGNGQLTPQQIALANALGWEMEVSIPTKNPSWTALVVDIGNRDLKIAIEVDGGSHLSKKQKNRDRKKAELLTQQGWSLVRFWNSEIDKDLEKCALSVLKMCQARNNTFTTSK
jgi:hypothetical protein